MVTVFRDLATDQPAWEVRFEPGVRPMAIEANADISTKRIFVELSGVSRGRNRGFRRAKGGGTDRSLPDLQFRRKWPWRTDATPCHGVAVAPDGKSLWINSTVDNAVFAFFAARPAAPWPCLAAGAQDNRGNRRSAPHRTEITFTPDSARLFVSNSALDSVSC